jgi:hypothetical protein
MRHRCQQAPGACRRVYFDVSIDAKPSRRIVMDLFDKVFRSSYYHCRQNGVFWGTENMSLRWVGW